MEKCLRGFEILKGYENTVQLPTIGTELSAGHDFYLPEEVVIHPGEVVIVPTGITAWMPPDEVLEIHIRSSLTVKKNIRLANCVGIIDADYYGNNIGAVLENFGKETVVLEKGSRVMQGIFHKYLRSSNSEIINKERTGGYGSTGENQEMKIK